MFKVYLLVIIVIFAVMLGLAFIRPSSIGSPEETLYLFGEIAGPIILLGIIFVIIDLIRILVRRKKKTESSK